MCQGLITEYEDSIEGGWFMWGIPVSACMCRMCSHIHTCQDVCLWAGRERTQTGKERSHSKWEKGWVSSQTDRLTCYKSQPQQHWTDLPRKTLWKKHALLQRRSVSVCVRVCEGISLFVPVVFTKWKCACAFLRFLQVVFLFFRVCLLNPALWISDVGGTHPLPLIRARAAASCLLLPALNFR